MKGQHMFNIAVIAGNLLLWSHNLLTLVHYAS